MRFFKTIMMMALKGRSVKSYGFLNNKVGIRDAKDLCAVRSFKDRVELDAHLA